MQLIPWNEQRERVFLDRYAKKDAEGHPVESTPREMWERVAKRVGENDGEALQFFEILKDWQFVPSGRILTGGMTLYNCFVQGFAKTVLGADSRSSIMATTSNAVEITARGGGVGINWSVLRPRDTYIRGVDGKSSASIAWMRGADGFIDAIRQGGTRTAALMFMLDVWHPDIIEFTRTGSRFNRANYSVGITDAFMAAVKNDAQWNLVFPDTTSPFYNREWDGDIGDWWAKGLPAPVYKTVQARTLWRALCESAYMTGNPGLGFMDRCNRWSNTHYLHRLVCFNPCGEQPLPVDGSCNLGSINLLAAIKDGVVQWEKLGMLVRYAVRFLDRVIDVDQGMTTEIDNLQGYVHHIGLGTMGLADVLILMGMRYGYDQSIEFIRKLYSFIRDQAYEASVDLAIEKGPAPGFQNEAFAKGRFIQTLPEALQERIYTHGIRNLALLTQAPTGTTSILAGASSGIEPIFSTDYTRTDATGCTTVRHPLADHPKMITALEVPVPDHIKVQAVLQEYLDSSISKTINLPKDSTVEDVDQAYQLSYAMGCKGVTVYRTGSEDGVLCESCNI